MSDPIKTCHAKIKLSQVTSGQFSICHLKVKSRSGQIMSARVRSSQSQVKSGQFRLSQVTSVQFIICHLKVRSRSAQVRSDQVKKSCQVMSKSGQVRSGQAKPAQVRSRVGQVKSIQVSIGHGRFRSDLDNVRSG